MKRYILILVLVFSLHTLVFGQKTGNIDAPDFNFPQTVITNADKRLTYAIDNDNNNEIITYVIQSSLAQSMISSDSLPKIINKISEVRTHASNPCTKAILHILEGHIINSYYNHNKYKISTRDNLNKPRSYNIFEWDEKQFKQYISQQIDSALYYKQHLEYTPITDFDSCIAINDISISTYPTLLDFIAYRGINIYNSWGFNNTMNPFVKGSHSQQGSYETKTINIYDTLLSFHHQGSRPYLKALLSKYDFFDKNSLSRLDSLYSLYKHSDNVAPILLRLTEKMSNTKAKYELLKSFMYQFPGSDYYPTVELALRSMEVPSGTISFNPQYTSTDSIRMTCMINNVSRFTVSIYDIFDINNAKKHHLSDKKAIYQTNILLKESTPFSDTISVTFPPLEYGKYIANIDVFDQKGNKLEQTNDYFNSFLVSDITSFSINDNKKKKLNIFAINAITGAPYKNVNISSSKAGKRTKQFSKQTNTKGLVSVDDSNYWNYQFSKGKDKFYSATIHKYHHTLDRNKFHNNASIFTDLAIYRPGDTIRMVAVCYKTNSFKKEILSNEKFKVTFYDTNHDSISSITLLSDEMGRISHDFIIPTNRLNGNFTLEINNYETNDFYSSHIVNVSEYKTPSFYVEFIDSKHSYCDTGVIVLHGIVKTFSDMPVADAYIKCSLQSAFWYGDYRTQADYCTRCDEMGHFSVELNANILKEFTQSPFISYRIIATATNDTGETQEGTTTFSLGSAITLAWEYDNNKFFNIDATKKVKLPISITSSGDTRTDIRCTLSLTNVNNHYTDTLHFSSTLPDIDFSTISSGEYMLNVWVENDSSTKINNKKIALFRPKDKMPPVKSALWIPYDKFTCLPGAESEILIGSAFDDCRYYYVVNYNDEIIEQGWKHLPKGISKFKFVMPKKVDTDLIIQLYCVKNLVPYNYSITVSPKKEEPNASLVIESFRDKITAGNQEKWTIHFSIDEKPSAHSAIIGALTDAALNQLKDNRWIFNPQLNTLPTARALSFQNKYSWGLSMNRFNWDTKTTALINALRKQPTVTAPMLNLYNQQYFSSRVNVTQNRLFIQSKSTESQFDGMVEENLPTSSSGAYGVSNIDSNDLIESELSDVKLRTADIKTVFWQPLLKTDENGNTSIEFTTPDMNTTWQFKCVGFDENLNTTTLLKEIVSNKPVMVSPNMPRFLRQGDTAILMASIQNATDTIQTGVAIVEIINPLTEEILIKQIESFNIKAKSSATISTELTIPDSLSVMGYRVKASTGKFSDGEQVLIPILPSVSPIIESKPFYIEPNRDTYTFNLPKFPKNARITLEYCNNPVWYIITAIPSIKNDNSNNAIGLANALFVNATASNIIDKYPQIRQAIDYWESHPEDSTLVSMLDKNQELKIGSLLASPWLNDSEEQTMRMVQLSKLFNKDVLESSTDKIIDKLTELQLGNGGFTWFYHSEAMASERITLTVLQLIGRINDLDTAHENAKLYDIIVKAIIFIWCRCNLYRCF